MPPPARHPTHRSRQPGRRLGGPGHPSRGDHAALRPARRAGGHALCRPRRLSGDRHPRAGDRHPRAEGRAGHHRPGPRVADPAGGHHRVRPGSRPSGLPGRQRRRHSCAARHRARTDGRYRHDRHRPHHAAHRRRAYDAPGHRPGRLGPARRHRAPTGGDPTGNRPSAPGLRRPRGHRGASRPAGRHGPPGQGGRARRRPRTDPTWEARRHLAVPASRLQPVPDRRGDPVGRPGGRYPYVDLPRGRRTDACDRAGGHHRRIWELP